MRYGAFGLVASVVLLAGSGVPAHQAQGPVASTRVTGGPVVSLDVPGNDGAAYSAAVGILIGAGVRFGVEGPALDPRVPLVDFARLSEPDPVTLTGLTVGEALDTIRRASPRFVWRETDGMILARLPNRDSLLDRRVRRFVLDRVTPGAALEALVRLLAPERVTADGIAGLRVFAVEIEGQPSADGISLAIDNGRVLEILNAIARAHGALSWTVSYARTPATAETATITLRSASRVLAVAGPPADPSAPRPTGPMVSRISVTGDLASMLSAYGQAARVPIGIERIAGPRVPAPIRNVPPLDLSDFPPREAVAVIVAHDSRYEWRERDGRFVVLPRAGVAQALLATRLPAFVRQREPAGSAISGLLQRIGAENVRTLPLAPVGPALPAGTLDAAERRLVDVSFRGATTAVDVLEAICRRAGNLSWTLRDQGSSSVLEITSPDGWRSTHSFTLARPTVAPPPRGARVPSEMDRDIRPVYLQSAGPDAFLVLASAAGVPIGLEISPADAVGAADPRQRPQPPPQPRVGPGRFSDALYGLLDRMRGYELTVTGGVLNIAPAGAAAQRDHFLDRPIGAFRFADTRVADVVSRLRRRMAGAPGGDAEPVTLPGGMAAFDQRISLDLPNPTPRDVLNAIVRLAGGLSWSVSYDSPAPDVAPRAVEEHSVVVLSVFPGPPGRALAFARDGSVRPAGASPVTTAVRPTGEAPRPIAGAVVPLPILDRQKESTVQRLCTALEIACSFELVSGPVRGPMGPPNYTSRYDFSGMSGPDALAKLTELVPDLAWSAEGSTYRIRSRALAGVSNLPLDRRVEVIERRLARFDEIFDLVRSLMDPSWQRPGSTIFIGPVSPDERSRDRPVDLNLRNVTVRQILDEIARQHGGLSWSVRYIEANGLYPEMMLTLATGSGGTGTSIRVR